MSVVKQKKNLAKKLRVLRSPKNYCDIRGGCYNNFNEKMGVYVINCSIHGDRMKKFKSYAQQAGVKACRIPCVIGKKFSDRKIATMIKDGIITKNTDMNKIEISINMSHYNAWQKLLDSCKEYALIFEDDVELKPDFVDQVNLIMDSLDRKGIDFSILFLWNGNWNISLSKQKKVLKINDKLQIMKETVYYNAGAVAYIISRKYAEWLTKPSRFFPIRYPQDIIMGSFPTRGNHLTLKMKNDKEQQCYVSPLLDMPCGGDGGTGESTQEYDAPTIKEIMKKKKKK